MKKLLIIILSACCIIFANSCRKLVEAPVPETIVVGSEVYESESSAEAVMIGVYSKALTGFPGFLSGSITQATGLVSDELQSYTVGGDVQQFYTNSISPSNATVNIIWTQAYQQIYTTNSLIEGLSRSTALTLSTKSRLTAEAKFMRAFSHFYLYAIFGDIPYIRSTDYRANAQVARNSTDEIYTWLSEDLTEAAAVLPGDFSVSMGERTRPNKWAAIALLARLELYRRHWQAATAYASQLIENPLFSLETDPGNVFLANSNECIFSLMPVIPGFNTREGNYFILTAPPSSSALSENLLNSFETGDLRKDSWVAVFSNSSSSWYYPYKYKVKINQTVSEYYVVQRLAEMYLIRAEAKLRDGDLVGAAADINIIRLRAGLPLLSFLNIDDGLNTILQERRIELFCEWGHRWFDIKRFGVAADILGSKPGWDATDLLFPIPQGQVTNDPNMQQNPGY